MLVIALLIDCSLQPTFNPEQANGGNPQLVNVNAQWAGIEFNYVYMIIESFLVFLIIPGIGLFYGGLSRRKSALAMLFQSILVIAVCTFQWMFWGYSLAFSRTAGPFIGDLANFGLKDVLAAPSIGGPIPEIVFCLYELMFCACTVMIVVGGSFERGRIIPSLVFGFFWATIVYCPIACWTWNPSGWLFTLPSLDFAGGGPVHIASGSAGLAYALILGKRKGLGETLHQKPHNTTLIFLGTCFIWFGWFGFNGGSAINASMRAMVAAFNTQVAASTGAIGWVTVDYIKHKRKFSVVGACEGVVAGLVGITPGAGYVSPWCAAAIGFMTAVIISSLQNFNKWIRIDDGLEVFKLHGIGGILGSFWTGIFATSSVSSLDGVTLAPGGIDGNAIQVGKQFAEMTAIASYSFLVSCCLLLILKYTPGFHLRVTDEAEMMGLDYDQFFDEAIGDWSLQEAMDMSAAEHGNKPTLTHGLARDDDRSSTEKTNEEIGVKA